MANQIRECTKKPIPTHEALVSAAVMACFDEEAKVLLVFSRSGFTARLASKYKPGVLILCVTTVPATARSLSLNRGVVSFLVDKTLTYSQQVNASVEFMKEQLIVTEGDKLVAVSVTPWGSNYVADEFEANTMRMIEL